MHRDAAPCPLVVPLAEGLMRFGPLLAEGVPDPPLIGSPALPLPSFSRGKVRDMYDLGDRLLMVTSDRISAFDVVMDALIPSKGIVPTALSAFWFARTGEIVE